MNVKSSPVKMVVNLPRPQLVNLIGVRTETAQNGIFLPKAHYQGSSIIK